MSILVDENTRILQYYCVILHGFGRGMRSLENTDVDGGFSTSEVNDR